MNVSSQAQFDQARLSLDVAEQTHAGAAFGPASHRGQASRGAVLAPGAGRVPKVQVTGGVVVMPGETIVTIAADNYIQHLQLPERHAQFMKAGDPILILIRS